MELFTLQIFTLMVLSTATWASDTEEFTDGETDSAATSTWASDIEQFIVGGTASAEGEFPYMARLMFEGEVRCGGTIVTPDWVLTGALCVSFLRNPSFQIQYGSVNVGSPNMKTVNVVLVKVNPVFDATKKIADSALLKVDSPMNVANVVKLPPADYETPAGKSAVVLGWGKESVNGKYSQVLKKYTPPILSAGECTRLFYTDYQSEYHICAGFFEPKDDHCLADGGGPLIVDGVQVGIISFGKYPCNEAPTYATIFTKVSRHISWLTYTIQHN